jgi:hypothetical protein
MGVDKIIDKLMKLPGGLFLVIVLPFLLIGIILCLILLAVERKALSKHKEKLEALAAKLSGTLVKFDRISANYKGNEVLIRFFTDYIVKRAFAPDIIWPGGIEVKMKKSGYIFSKVRVRIINKEHLSKIKEYRSGKYIGEAELKEFEERFPREVDIFSNRGEIVKRLLGDEDVLNSLIELIDMDFHVVVDGNSVTAKKVITEELEKYFQEDLFREMDKVLPCLASIIEKV